MRFVLLAALLVGCGDDGGSNPPMIDAPPAAACTGAVYDPCTTASTTSSECMSMNCKLFDNDNLTICTQTCTPGTACPMAGSTPVTCNNMGFCKPPAANNCTR
jgi:hypothetical protein